MTGSTGTLDVRPSSGQPSLAAGLAKSGVAGRGAGIGALHPAVVVAWDSGEAVCYICGNGLSSGEYIHVLYSLAASAFFIIHHVYMYIYVCMYDV